MGLSCVRFGGELLSNRAPVRLVVTGWGVVRGSCWRWGSQCVCLSVHPCVCASLRAYMGAHSAASWDVRCVRWCVRPPPPNPLLHTWNRC